MNYLTKERLQEFLESTPAAYEITRKTFGITMSELIRQIEAKQITLDEFLMRIAIIPQNRT
ncbi:hypothetical protein [Myxosarcina sp. GI1(2024)]